MWGHSKKVAEQMLERVCSPDIESISTLISLILDSLASRNVKSNCLLFKAPNLWYFVIASQADYENHWVRDDIWKILWGKYNQSSIFFSLPFWPTYLLLHTLTGINCLALVHVEIYY
jgi:hypothetical protein